MNSKSIKAFLYNLISFIVLFILAKYFIVNYTSITGFYIPLTAFLVGTFLAPKFQAVQTVDGNKLFIKWLFIKEVKEIN